MKLFKRLVSLCLTLLMLLGCLSGLTLNARAEETDPVSYDVWVLGTQVTEENREDVLEDGTVRYDPAAKTLYLDSLGTRTYHGESAIEATGDLILELNGKTILNQSNYGVRVTGSLRVRGSGSLTTTGKDTGVYASSLYLDDEENKTGLNANGYYYGIRAGELHLRQGTLTATSFGYANETSDPVPGAGIYAFLGVLEIGSPIDLRYSRSNVTLTASGAQGAPAIYAFQGIRLSDNVQVTVPASYTLSADGRTVNDGNSPAASVSVAPKEAKNLLLSADWGGTLVSDQPAGKVYPGQPVSVWAVPDEGMYLNDISIDGETGPESPVTCSNGTYTFTMPDEDVSVYANFSDWPFYDVLISGDITGGSVTTPLLRQPEGELVALTATPEGDNELLSLTVTTASGLPVDIAYNETDSTWEFEMPAQDVTVSAVFALPEYTVTIAPFEHGTVTAERSTYHEGEKVNLTVTPEYGWYVKSFEVRREDGGRIGDATTAGFTMPAINVTVTVTFDRGYPLWVGNTQVTDENAADILGNGQFCFDPAARTLTVNGTDAVNPSTFHSNAVVSAEMDFTLAGNGSLKSDKAFCAYGIYAKNHTVTVDAEDLQISGKFGGILAGEVVFAGGTSSISATPSGVGVKTEGSGKVIFAEGITQVQITSGNSYPVSSAGRIDIDDCNEIRVPEGGMIYSVGNGYYFADADGNSESVRSVTVAAKPIYTITARKIVTSAAKCDLVLSTDRAYPGEAVTIQLVPTTNYTVLTSVTVKDASGNPVEFENLGDYTFRFVMPCSNVTAEFRTEDRMEIGGPYSIRISETDREVLTADRSAANPYELVTLTFNPNCGCVLDSLQAATDEGDPVSLTKTGENTYTFTMPEDTVNVTCTYTFVPRPIRVVMAGIEPPESHFFLVDLPKTLTSRGEAFQVSVKREPEGFTFLGLSVSGITAQIESWNGWGTREYLVTPSEYTGDEVVVTVSYRRNTPLESYPVWIGKTQVNSQNKDDVLGNGVLRYDPDTQTLHLNGDYSFTNLSFVDYLIKSSGIDLTLTGSGIILYDETSTFSSAGVLVEDGSLTVNGDITVNSQGSTLVANNVILAAGNVAINSTSFAVPAITCRNGGTLFVANGARLVSSSKSSQDYVNGSWVWKTGTAVAAGSVMYGTELAMTTPAGGYCDGTKVVTASGGLADRVVIENKPLSVTLDPASHAAISVSPRANNLTLGTEVSFTLTPEAGYTLGAVEVRTETGDRVPFTKEGETYRLTMPTENVTVVARCSPILYNIAVADTEHGTVTPSVTAAFVGQTVSLEYLADPGYMPGVVMVTDAEGNRVTVTDDAFVMPASNVTVDVIFDQGEVQYPLWLGDTQVTNRNAADIFEDGKASYDHATHTLTLNNPSNWTAGHTALNHEHLIYTELPNLIVTGSATLSTSNERGFYAPNGTLTLSGSLQITSFYETVWAKDIVIADGTIKLNITGQYSVIRSENSLRFEKEITSIELTGKSNSNVLSYASLYISDDLAVTNPEGAYHDGSRVYNADGSAYTGSALKLEHRSDFGVRIESAHGTVTATPARANPGDTVTLTVVADAGYSFNHFTVTDAAGNEIPVGTDGSFTMPGGEAFVVAHYDAIDYQVAGYFRDHGTVEPTQSVYHVGDSVLLRVQPEIGYELSQLRAEDENGVTIPVTEEDDGWRFTMPASDVTLSAVFERGVYTVTPVESAHGTPTADKQTAYYGDVVTLTAPDAVGYTMTGFAVIDSAGNQIPVTENQFTMPAADVTFSAIYTPNDYTVTVAEAAHGSVTARPQIAHMGDTVTLTVIPDTGYRLKDLRVEEDGLDNNPVVTPSLTTLNVTHDENSNDWTFTMPASNVTVTAEFEAIDYTVTITEAEHGSVTASKTTANYGEEITLTANSDPGCVLQSLTVTTQAGEEIPVTDGSFTMPNDDVTVTAVFSVVDYTVTVNPVTNGTVTADKAIANYGDTVTLTVTPDTGYAVETITVLDENGSEIPVSENSFTMPASDVTVSVIFKAIDYTITVNAPTHATVTVPETAHYGDTVPLTVTTDAGYPLSSLTVTDEDGNEIPVTDGSFTMPASNVTVTVQVTATDYTLTVPPAVNGSVSASKSVANAGDEITLTVEPAEGYVLDRIYVYDFVYHSIPLNEDNTFTMPAANVLVLAYFKLAPYTVTIAPTEHGTVTADKTTANAGERVTLTVTPDADCQLASLTVTDAEGNEVDLVNGHFTMPASSVTVTAVFNAAIHTVTVSDTVNGTVTADPTSACMGDTVTLTVTPDEGYELNTLTVTDSENQTVEVTDNQFTMPASDVTVTATFKLIDFTVTVAAYENGTVTADPTENLHLGDTVTLTVTPDAGYALDALLVKDADNNEIAVEHDQFTMPASNVTVTATFKAIDYTVTVAETVNGTVTADQETAHAGDTVTLTVTPNEGYWLRSLTVTEEGGSEVNVTESTFTMPSANVIVTAVFVNTYGVIVVAAPNGTVSVDKEEPRAGETVTLTVTPDEGYELVSMIATDSSGTQLDLTAGEDGTYTFPMPASDVTVTPVFEVLLVEYDLWLGDTQVTSRNAADILGNGKASYDHETRTLNLNGLEGVSTVHNVDSTHHVIYTGSIDLTVTGSGTIKWTKGTAARAIYAPNTSVTLNGDLTVQSYYECIHAKGLTVAGGSVVLSTSDYARAIVLTRGGNLRIENGTTLFEASSKKSETDRIIVLYSGSAFMGDGLEFEDPTGGSFSNGGDVLNADGTMYHGGHVKIVPKPSCSITCEASSNGTVTADKASTYAGDTVTLTVTPDAGYELDALTVTYGENQTVEVTNNQFTMPDADVTVTATFKLIEYTVTVAESANGSVAASAATAHVGEEITLTVTPDEGYELNTLTVTYGENGTVTVEDNKFTMPASNVTVTATFKTKAPVTYTYFVSQSLTLAGDIGVNFYVNLNEVSKDNAKVVFTWGSGTYAKTQENTFSGLTADGDGNYKLSVQVYAKQMTEMIHAELYDGTEKIAEKDYCVADYCRKVLNMPIEELTAVYNGNAAKAEKLVNLCKAMLIYGGTAQKQFKYRTDDLADKDLEYTLEDVGTLGTTTFPEGFAEACGIEFWKSSLMLESETSYRMYFSVTDQTKLDNLTVKLGNETLSYTKSGSYIYYSISNIPAKMILSDYTLTFGDQTVTANAGEYIAKALDIGGDGLKETAKALYRYSTAAIAYYGAD